MEPTLEQKRIAREFHVPMALAHTISLERAKAYKEYLASNAGQLEKFFDEQARSRKYYNL
jgi:hypothetical protein